MWDVKVKKYKTTLITMTLKWISSGLVKNIKRINKRTKSAFFQNIYSQLDEINETNPKLFWKTIYKIKKCGRTPQQNPIKKDQWENHLKNLFKKWNNF